MDTCIIVSQHCMCRFGCSSGSYCLVMKACYQYWNACLPLATSSFGRGLLCDPMLKLLSLVATFIRRRKETVFEPHEHSFSLEQDHNTLKAMYGLVFQVFADKVIHVTCPSTLCYLFTWKESLIQIAHTSIFLLKP